MHVQSSFHSMYACILLISVCMNVYSSFCSHTSTSQKFIRLEMYTYFITTLFDSTESEWGCNVPQPPSQSVIPTTWTSYGVQHPHHIHRYNRGPPPPPLPPPGMKNSTRSPRLMVISTSAVSWSWSQQWLSLYIPLHWFLCYYWLISSSFYLLYVLMYFFRYSINIFMA